jgi:exopolysaccharide biosynthesis polyprenyl glycosylphosphotransferase
MSLQSLSTHLINQGRRVESGGRRAVRSHQVLRRALEKERARADRSGDTFYWVLFSLNGTDPAKRILRRLGETIATRARDTDEVGWFDETAVGVILLETDREGVQCFLADILRLASEQNLNPKAIVYSYPAPPPSSGDTPTRRLSMLSNDSGARRRSSPTSASSAAIATRASHQQYESLAMKEHLLLPIPWWKRTADIVGASIGLLLTSPILFTAAVAVKISSPGPVLFVQRRAGLGGRPFSMYKFRSMYIGADALKATLRHQNEQDGPAFKMKNDPRLTPIGRFLRSSSIDELPQLFNVLKGEMSLVGPRPPTFDEVSEYQPWYVRRLDVTPGITCIWQVRGRAEVTFESWMRMDIQYIRNYGFWQDVKLLLATIPAVFSRRGAH